MREGGLFLAQDDDDGVGAGVGGGRWGRAAWWGRWGIIVLTMLLKLGTT